MDDNELSDMWRGHNKLKQEQHEEWHVMNMNTLKSSGLTYTKKGNTCIFREENKPMVDFYPHTGRWRIVGKNAPQTVFTGGGNAFIHWYNKRTQK